jgi:hypothetical protein
MMVFCNVHALHQLIFLLSVSEGCFLLTAASDPFANMFGSMDMSKMQGPGGTTGPTPLDLDALLAGGPPGPNSGPSMGFTTPSQPQMSPQGTSRPLDLGLP